jgi:hypothetical protein
MRLLAGGDPSGVRVEEEEEDHAESHEVHVDEEKDSAVVEAPARLHAAEGIDCAGDSDESGNNEEGRGAIVGEVREKKRDAETQEDKCASTKQGSVTRIEEVNTHVTAYRLDLLRM